MTGSTLYEAVEQHALWNRLLGAVMSDMTATDGDREVSHSSESKAAAQIVYIS